MFDHDERILKITGALDALLRDDPYEAYDLLRVMLGDAQFERDFEDFGGQNRRGSISTPKRSDYPKPEPRTEKN